MDEQKLPSQHHWFTKISTDVCRQYQVDYDALILQQTVNEDSANKLKNSILRMEAQILGECEWQNLKDGSFPMDSSKDMNSTRITSLLMMYRKQLNLETQAQLLKEKKQTCKAEALSLGVQLVTDEVNAKNEPIYVRCLEKYSPTEEGCLSFVEGEVLEVNDAGNENWWGVTNSKDRKGDVPTSLIKLSNKDSWEAQNKFPESTALCMIAGLIPCKADRSLPSATEDEIDLSSDYSNGDSGSGLPKSPNTETEVPTDGGPSPKSDTMSNTETRTCSTSDVNEIVNSSNGFSPSDDLLGVDGTKDDTSQSAESPLTLHTVPMNKVFSVENTPQNSSPSSLDISHRIAEPPSPLGENTPQNSSPSSLDISHTIKMLSSTTRNASTSTNPNECTILSAFNSTFLSVRTPSTSFKDSEDTLRPDSPTPNGNPLPYNETYTCSVKSSTGYSSDASENLQKGSDQNGTYTLQAKVPEKCSVSVQTSFVYEEDETFYTTGASPSTLENASATVLSEVEATSIEHHQTSSSSDAQGVEETVICPVSVRKSTSVVDGDVTESYESDPDSVDETIIQAKMQLFDPVKVNMSALDRLTVGNKLCLINIHSIFGQMSKIVPENWHVIPPNY